MDFRGEIMDGVPVILGKYKETGVLLFGKAHWYYHWLSKGVKDPLIYLCKEDEKKLNSGDPEDEDLVDSIAKAFPEAGREELETHKKLVKENEDPQELIRSIKENMGEKEKEIIGKLGKVANLYGDEKAFFDSIYLGKVVPHLFAPTRIEINITRRCNAECVYCFARERDMKKPGEELPLERWMSFIEEAAALGVRDVTFSGGEPLLRADDTLTLCRRAAELGMSPSILTNGSRITEKIAQEIKEIQDMSPYMYVQVDLDSLKPEVHEKLRPGASFEKVMHAIGHLKENGVVFTLNAVVTRLNYSEITDLVRFAGKMNAKGIKFMAMNKMGRGKEVEIGLSTEEQFALGFLTITLNAKAKDYNIKYVVDTFGHPALKNMENDINAGDTVVCEALRGTMSLTPDGSLIPCAWLLPNKEVWGERYGEKSILQLWNSQLAEWWRGAKVGEPCKSCKICSGACRAYAYVHGGIGCAAPDCPIVAGWDKDKIGVYRYSSIATTQVLRGG